MPVAFLDGSKTKVLVRSSAGAMSVMESSI